MNGYIETKQTFLKQKTEIIIDFLKMAFFNASLPVKSWEKLINVLKNSNKFRQLPDSLVIGIEVACVTGGMSIDLLLVFVGKDNQKHAYVIEVKNWQDDYINTLTFSDNRRGDNVLHPQIQVSNHALSFGGYTDIGQQYAVMPYVYVMCSSKGIETLIKQNPDKNIASRITIINNLDSVFDEIKANAHPYPNPFVQAEIISELKNAQYEPSKGIIAAMSNIVAKENAFILTNKQQQTVENVLSFIKRKKKIIKISGPAGSGKTAILIHLYLELLKQDNTRPILVTGAYNTDYYRSVFPNSKGVFEFSQTLDAILSNNDGKHNIVLMDEAQHNTEGEATKVLNMGATLVVCYDERQTIRAINCVEELQRLESRKDFASVKLADSMRYNGSNKAEQNVKNYLENKPLEKDDKFFFKACTSFKEFQSELTRLIEDNPKSTVATVGLLSKDKDDYTVKKNSASILKTHWGEKAECEWMKYVVDKDYLTKNNGKIWVGTWWMQGLDVDYVAVIVGGDAVLTNKGVSIDLKNSKLYQTIISVAEKMGLPSKLKDKHTNVYANNIVDYIEKANNDQTKMEFEVISSQYVKNYYYIMMTRARKGCLVYFTNSKRR